MLVQIFYILCCCATISNFWFKYIFHRVNLACYCQRLIFSILLFGLNYLFFELFCLIKDVPATENKIQFMASIWLKYKKVKEKVDILSFLLRLVCGQISFSCAKMLKIYMQIEVRTNPLL